MHTDVLVLTVRVYAYKVPQVKLFKYTVSTCIPSATVQVVRICSVWPRGCQLN